MRNRWVLLKIITVLLVCTTAVSHATPAFVESSTVTAWFTNNRNGADDDDDYQMYLQRLRARSASQGTSASARIDAVKYTGRSGVRVDDTRVERLQLKRQTNTHHFIIGDFYRQLGKGLLLSLRKVDEVGFDVVLRGAEFGYKFNDIGLAVFAGRVNTVNIDNLKNKFVADPDDILSGAELSYRWRGGKAGLHSLFRRNETGIADSELYDGALGAGGFLTQQFSDGDVNFYLEAAHQEVRVAESVDRGHAVYSSIFWGIGDLSNTLELLSLHNFTQNGSPRAIKGQASDFFRYNQPPTLDRIDQQTSQGIDERALRLSSDYSFLDGDFLISSNFLWKEEFPGASNEITTLHGYGNSEYTYDLGRSRVSLGGGARRLQLTAGDSPQDFRSLLHSEFNWLMHLTGRLSLSLASQMEFRTLEGSPFKRGSNFIGLERGGIGSLTFEYGIDTQRQGAQIRNHYFAGIAVWNVTGFFQLKGTVGTQRGGLKCVAGICRDYPSFAGSQLEMLVKGQL